MRRRLVALVAVLGLWGGVPVAADGAAPAYSVGLHVIPFPGTPDASRVSSVIFSSLRPSDISSVVVTGSSSGLHTGRLTALPDHAGAAFVPDSRFTPGERVNVRAALTSSQAGTASGDPGATVLNFSFTVAKSPFYASGASRLISPSTTPAPGACTECMRFHSVTDFYPPIVRATADRDTRSGDIFLTAKINQGSGQQGPMILGPRGQLVWFDPLGGAGPHLPYAMNLEVQRYQGQPVLTFWTAGHEVIMNRHYQTIATVHAGDGYGTDEHDFQITPQGTGLLETYFPVRANLTSVGGDANAVVWDCIVQEVDIKTGQVLWEWHSLGHVPVNASYLSEKGSYAYFHLNSLQELPSGNVVISSRYTWGVYEIDKQTGKLVWTLGGKYSTFKIGKGAHFSFQHDAHLAGNTLTVFNDACDGPQQQQSQSSAKILRLNPTTRTATLIHAYRHTPPLLANSQGSVQTLPDHNIFIGWGNQPDLSEYTPKGRQIFNATLPFGVNSYRAYRFQWTGQPLTKPALAISPQPHHSVKLYASWNGATQVESWRVLAGPTPNTLHPLKTTPHTGFETEITLHSKPRYLAIQALDSHNHTLASSQTHPDR